MADVFDLSRQVPSVDPEFADVLSVLMFSGVLLSVL